MRPASEALPVSGEPFSLRCVGAQNPAGVTWQRNGRSMPTSERVRLSPDGITLTFSPLLQADGGSYQCVVSEGGGPVQSEGYHLRVICEYERGHSQSRTFSQICPWAQRIHKLCNDSLHFCFTDGPDEVTMVNPNKGSVGKEMFALPGSKTELQCSADCFPACSFTWFYHGTLLSKDASVLFTPPTPPNQAALNCVALNSVTKKSSTIATVVVVPGKQTSWPKVRVPLASLLGRIEASFVLQTDQGM